MTEHLAEFAAEYERRGTGAVMWEMITGYRIGQIVRVAVALSLAQHCADGPVSAEQVAGLESADVTATARFLRASAAIGLVRCVDGPRFAGPPLLVPRCTGTHPDR
jgi:Dimerisation domain